jgi:hypothetical protein
MQAAQVAYVGFRSLPTGREYKFRVTRADGNSQDFQLAVSNEAFLRRDVRYQDAAEICFLKLQRAVLACEPGLPALYQEVTEQDFEAYRVAHAPKARNVRPPPPVMGAGAPALITRR